VKVHIGLHGQHFVQSLRLSAYVNVVLQLGSGELCLPTSFLLHQLLFLGLVGWYG